MMQYRSIWQCKVLCKRKHFTCDSDVQLTEMVGVSSGALGLFLVHSLASFCSGFVKVDVDTKQFVDDDGRSRIFHGVNVVSFGRLLRTFIHRRQSLVQCASPYTLNRICIT